MTGLFRTSLFFFLPVFCALMVYQYYVSEQPTLEEKKASFRETHAQLLDKAKESAESWLLVEKEGRKELPGELESAGIILTEVVFEMRPVVTAVSSPLFAEGKWSLYPDPRQVPAHISKFQFRVGSPPDVSEIDAILFEEIIYRPNGDPVRLNVFVKKDVLADYE